MPLHTFSNEYFHLVVSTRGGSILRLQSKINGVAMPLLRESVESEDTPPLASGCFPLVPFGNRVRNNVFTFEGEIYHLSPNVDWDAHYLHGDSWLGEWAMIGGGEDFLELTYEHIQAGAIYSYVANQRFELVDDRFVVTLTVTNRGAKILPFGLGWHPYFTMDRDTTLEAPAKGYWTEGDRWLPEQYQYPPQELDFSSALPLPDHWVNNGFDGWNGNAYVRWPSRKVELAISSPCSYYFVFVSDTRFDPSFQHDFFCFEPMSHAADAHSSRDQAGLVLLSPQESMSLSMTMKVRIAA